MTVSKKKKSRIIVPLIILAAVILSVVLIQPIKSIIAMSSMKPLETQKVLPDVFAVKNIFVNFYLLKSGEKYIAFDAGADISAVQSALSALGIDENDVIAVFLTHTDYDHVAAIPLFSSAVIYMAKSNQIFIEESPARSKVFNDMNREYKTMDNNETITVAGVDIQCVFTPGHTNGSASYIVNNYLFAGDNLSIKDGKAALFNSVFNMNNDEQKQSITRLSKLEGIEIIFTMHYGYTTDFKTAFSMW